ncbi:MAG: hypothetical protein ORN26_01985 [Candidatus Pacebacteria bacterium]|nr:hypothetical protein [Candidatus Paceibacterota bacterium]
MTALTEIESLVLLLPLSTFPVLVVVDQPKNMYPVLTGIAVDDAVIVVSP